MSSAQPTSAIEQVPEAAPTADADLLAELHADQGAALFDFARHLGLTDEHAADAVQEALLRLWREMRRGSVVERPIACCRGTLTRVAQSGHE